jgi:hypothetical protein
VFAVGIALAALAASSLPPVSTVYQHGRQHASFCPLSSSCWGHRFDRRRSHQRMLIGFRYIRKGILWRDVSSVLIYVLMAAVCSGVSGILGRREVLVPRIPKSGHRFSDQIMRRKA